MILRPYLQCESPYFHGLWYFYLIATSQRPWSWGESWESFLAWYGALVSGHMGPGCYSKAHGMEQGGLNLPSQLWFPLHGKGKRPFFLAMLWCQLQEEFLFICIYFHVGVYKVPTSLGVLLSIFSCHTGTYNENFMILKTIRAWIFKNLHVFNIVQVLYTMQELSCLRQIESLV